MKNLISQDGELYYLPGFIPAGETQTIFQRLEQEMNWQQEVVTIVGRTVPVPRLVAWHGDEGAIYQYSGLTHYPKPWTETLLALKQAIEDTSRHGFNSVLGNLYRNGQDSMGWHSDQEKVLGRNPVIASLSLGQERLFKLRHNKTGETVDIVLADGSLLLMAGALQHHWRHCVPKSAKATNPRINLTFRKIINQG
jgi:alkylated DNA repair dioxygenase AlkB